MVPSNIKEFTESFIIDSKPPTKNEKSIAEHKNKKAASKPPSHAELCRSDSKNQDGCKEDENFLFDFQREINVYS